MSTVQQLQLDRAVCSVIQIFFWKIHPNVSLTLKTTLEALKNVSISRHFRVYNQFLHHYLANFCAETIAKNIAYLMRPMIQQFSMAPPHKRVRIIRTAFCIDFLSAVNLFCFVFLICWPCL